MTTAIPAAGEAVTPAQQQTTTGPRPLPNLRLNLPVEGQPQATPDAAGDPPAETVDTTDKTEKTDKTTPSDPAAETAGEGDKKTRKPSRLDTIVALRQQRRDQAAEIQKLRAENQRLLKPIVPAEQRETLDYDQLERLRVREALRENRREELTERETEIRTQDRQLAEQEVEAIHTTVLESLDAAQDRFPGLVEAFATKINLTQDTVDFLAHSEKAAELADHLVKNPDVATELYHLTNPRTANAASRREADRILVRLEEKIQKPTRKPTQAPDPGTILNGGSPPGPDAPLEELGGKGNMNAFAPKLLEALKARKRR